jgi:hypothetical protein
MKLDLELHAVRDALQSLCAAISPIVAELLTLDAFVVELASLISDPGAKEQIYHPDTLLPNLVGTPLYTCFVALQDIDLEMGPTRVLPGSHNEKSHRDLRDKSDRGATIRKAADASGCHMGCRAGDAFLMDSRLWHRGGRNSSKHRRRLLYVTFGAPFCRPPGSTYSILDELVGRLRLRDYGLWTQSRPEAAAPSANEAAKEALSREAQAAACGVASRDMEEAAFVGPTLPADKRIKGASDWACELGARVDGKAFAPHVCTSRLQASRLARLASITSADVVCDLGCGDATFLGELVCITGCSATGCDVDGDAIASGRARFSSVEAQRVRLTQSLISEYVQGDDYQMATCIFVFLVPQMLQELTPHFVAFLGRRPGNRILTQRYPIDGLIPCASLEDRAMDDRGAEDDPLHQHLGHRHDYFGKSLGAAFLYQA